MSAATLKNSYGDLFLATIPFTKKKAGSLSAPRPEIFRVESYADSAFLLKVPAACSSAVA